MTEDGELVTEESEPAYTFSIALVSEHGKSARVTPYRTREKAHQRWREMTNNPQSGWVLATLLQYGIGAIRIKRFSMEGSKL